MQNNTGNLEEIKESYLSSFSNRTDLANSSNPSWLSSTRKKAISNFKKIGFPNLKSEDWKYTDITPIIKQPLDFSTDIDLDNIDINIEDFCYNSNWPRLTFVNGFYSEKLSFIPLDFNKIQITSFNNALKNNPDTLNHYLEKTEKENQTSFTLLNTAFFNDGAFLHIPKNQIIKQPIHLIYISNSPINHKISPLKNLILLEPFSQATIIETFLSTNNSTSTINLSSEIILNQGASLDHFKLNTINTNSFILSANMVKQLSDSNYKSTSLILGSQITRAEDTIYLQEKNSTCSLNGLYYSTQSNQHHDNKITVHHNNSYTNSHQLFKGIINKQSRAAFHGKVIVNKNTTQNKATQTNKNLLLSESSTVNTRPQLEIFADDVECSHGATVGQIDTDVMFYLLSRGINKAQATELLTYAFANEIIETIAHDEIKNHFESNLKKSFLS